MTHCLHSLSYPNSCVIQAILPRLDYVTFPLRHTEENNQVTWHDTWNQAVRSIFFFFLPAVYSHTSICKANRTVSHNHLRDEPRQCKEPWLPLQLAKTHKYLQIPWTLNIGRMDDTLKVSFYLLRLRRELRGVVKTFKCPIFRWLELDEMDPDLQIARINLA